MQLLHCQICLRYIHNFCLDNYQHTIDVLENIDLPTLLLKSAGFLASRVKKLQILSVCQFVCANACIPWRMFKQTWNLSQASQACLCKVFGAGVNFYLECMQLLLQICLSLCTRP